MPLPLQCNWGSPPIDIEGLNDSDKKRIKEIGFDKWLEEVSMTEATKQLRSKFSGGIKQETPQQTVDRLSKELSENHTKLISIIDDCGHGFTRGVGCNICNPKPTVSIGKKGMFLAEEFVKVAKANNGIVTKEMALKIDKVAADPAYYARLLGHEIETDRKNHRWILKEKR